MCSNRKTADLIINTSNSCFLCYQETGIVKHGPLLFPLRSLCRQLKVNLSQTLSVGGGSIGGGTVTSPSSESGRGGGGHGGGGGGHGGGSRVQVQVSLCEACWPVTEGFSKLYRELEAVKMKLDICLEAIDDKLRGVEDNPQLVERHRRKLEGDAEAMRDSRIVKELRREIMLKYRSYSKKCQPRIKIKASPESPMMGRLRGLRSRDYLIPYETALATADMISFKTGIVEPAPEVGIGISSKTTTILEGGAEDLQSSAPMLHSILKNLSEDNAEKGDPEISPGPGDPNIQPQDKNHHRLMLKRNLESRLAKVTNPNQGNFAGDISQQLFMTGGSAQRELHREVAYKDKAAAVTPDIPTVTATLAGESPPSTMPQLTLAISPNKIIPSGNARSLDPDQGQAPLNLTEDQKATSSPGVPPAHVRKQLHSTLPHVSISSPEKSSRHKCDVCQGLFATKGGLSLHRSLMHGIPSPQTIKALGLKIVCDICQESFGTRTQLRLHRENIHVGYQFTCKYCNKKCLTRIALLNHYMSVCSNPRNRQGQQGPGPESQSTSSGINQPQPAPESEPEATSSQAEEIQVVDIEEDEEDPAQLCSNLPITIEAVPEAEADEHPPRTPPEGDIDTDTGTPQITMVRSLCPPAEDNLSCGVEIASADPDPEIVTIDDTDTQMEKNIQSIQIPAPPGRPPGPKPRSTWRRRNLTNLSYQQSLESPSNPFESLQPSSHLPSILRRPGPRLPPTPPPPIAMRSSFPCKLCDDKFSTMEGLKSHIKLRHMKDPRLQQMLSGISVSQKRPVAPAPVPSPSPVPRKRPSTPPDIPLQPSPCPTCPIIFTNEYWLREHICKANRPRVFKSRRQALETMATPSQAGQGQGTSHHHQSNMGIVDLSDGSSDNDRDPPSHIITNPEPIIVNFNYPDDADEEIISEDEQMEVDNIDPLA